MKLKIGMLDHMNNTFRNTVFQIPVDVPLKRHHEISIFARDKQILAPHNGVFIFLQFGIKLEL